jgi:hypothetical protein
MLLESTHHERHNTNAQSDVTRVGLSAERKRTAMKVRGPRPTSLFFAILDLISSGFCKVDLTVWASIKWSSPPCPNYTIEFVQQYSLVFLLTLSIT